MSKGKVIEELVRIKQQYSDVIMDVEEALVKIKAASSEALKQAKDGE